MNRTRIRRAAVAVLAVLAVLLLAVAATPLFSQTPGADQSPSLDQPDLDRSDGNADLDRVPGRTLFVAACVFGLAAVVVQFLNEPWKALSMFLGGAIGLVMFVLLALALVSILPSPGPTTPPPDGTPVSTTPALNGTEGFGSGSDSPLALPVGGGVALVLLAGLGGLVVLLARRSGALGSAFSRDATEDETDLASVGRAAGDAAERVEAASTPSAADNAIYRAWTEMVDLLDVGGPRDATPRQFERKAIEAGMDPTDVGVLTWTFEEVRYGDAALTTDRRERAREALERIEAAHAEANGDAGLDTSDTEPEGEGDDAGRDTSDTEPEGEGDDAGLDTSDTESSGEGDDAGRDTSDTEPEGEGDDAGLDTSDTESSGEGDE